MEHTKGPWEAKLIPGAGWEIRAPIGEQDFVEVRSVEGRLYQIFVESWTQFPPEDYRRQMEANAHLIAAAPDLLAACQDALEVMQRMDHGQATRLAAVVAKATPSAEGQAGATP